jgi:hypothetical protein
MAAAVIATVVESPQYSTWPTAESQSYTEYWRLYFSSSTFFNEVLLYFKILHVQVFMKYSLA